MRCGPELPALMYDSEGIPLFPFYWTSDPRAIKGVHDAQLTAFERETVSFLDNFCRLDTKELLQRETDVDSIVAYLKRMRTVSEDEWLSYLAKSNQKKLEPEALVSPEVQLVVGETDVAKGAKRKKWGEMARSSKALKKNDGSSNQVMDLEAGGSQSSPPQPKGGRVLRGRMTIPVKTAGEDTPTQEGVSKTVKDAVVNDGAEIVVKETEVIKDAVPPPVAAAVSDGDKSSAWGKSFDPV
ncbi:hypothetical protein A2U01_0031118, partial [Trifolium medium]|nr:hypothetical protein [Trifolium medium]